MIISILETFQNEAARGHFEKRKGYIGALIRTLAGSPVLALHVAPKFRIRFPVLCPLQQKCVQQLLRHVAKVWPWFKTNGIPFWGFRCTTHFSLF